MGVNEGVKLTRKEYRRLKKYDKRKKKRQDKAIQLLREKTANDKAGNAKDNEVNRQEEIDSTYFLTHKEWKIRDTERKEIEARIESKQQNLKNKLSKLLGKETTINDKNHTLKKHKINNNKDQEDNNKLNKLNKQIIELETHNKGLMNNKKQSEQQSCITYNKLGICILGPNCYYLHTTITEGHVIIIPNWFQFDYFNKSKKEMKERNFNTIKEANIFFKLNLKWLGRLGAIKNLKISYHPKLEFSGHVYIEYATITDAKYSLNELKFKKSDNFQFLPRFLSIRSLNLVLCEHQLKYNQCQLINNCNQLHWLNEL
ncbi:hypothetical protein K502DRAFT_352645 [Neoconidiobolus thromboides FSU 785]|nr:hypothetical protein K502DRAFT_352645 [Neoconidiobolus thromboides FSU 785]